MTFECLTPDEIRSKYNRADNKASALRVLAELTASTEIEVADFLGVELPTKGKMHKRMAYQLYMKKMSDQEIAEKLGVSRVAVYDWRIERGLPPHNAKPGHEARMEVYLRGLSDRQAAKELGIGRSTFRNWRYKNNLEPNGGDNDE
jgi:transposase